MGKGEWDLTGVGIFARQIRERETKELMVYFNE